MHLLYWVEVQLKCSMMSLLVAVTKLPRLLLFNQENKLLGLILLDVSAVSRLTLEYCWSACWSFSTRSISSLPVRAVRDSFVCFICFLVFILLNIKRITRHICHTHLRGVPSLACLEVELLLYACLLTTPTKANWTAEHPVRGCSSLCPVMPFEIKNFFLPNSAFLRTTKNKPFVVRHRCSSSSNAEPISITLVELFQTISN